MTPTGLSSAFHDPRAILLVGMHGSVATRASTHLRRLGAAVDEVTIADGASHTAIRTQFDAAVSSMSECHGVVLVPEVSHLVDRGLVTLDEDAWDREAEAPIRTALTVLQSSRACFASTGGSVVIWLPSIALTGAAGLVAFATACEGIRLLAKSAARSWGTTGIRVNCLSLPLAVWCEGHRDGNLVPNRFGPSLPPDDPVAAASAATCLLLMDLASGVTGATIGVDRGEVMAP